MASPSRPHASQPIVVQKFGGTSVGDAEKIQRVARIITDTFEQGNRVVAVISAMGHSTDHLVDLAKKISATPGGREYDALLATGEMVSVSLMAMAIQNLGYSAIGLNGMQAGVHTEDLYNRARILEIKTQAIERHLNEGTIVIVTGFQGVNSLGDFTTLGRGGSDTSAVALAGALGASRCDIFTDVRGVYSTDPRVVPDAVKLNEIAYIEMLELARVGAQVLHPRAVETARQAEVQVFVRSTFDLEDPGTRVVGVEAMELERNVAGIACDDSQARLALLTVPDKPGVAAEIFGSLASHNISVDMIIQSLSSDKTNDIAFTVSLDDLNDAIRVLEEVKVKIGAEAVKVDEDIAKVSIVGAGMIDRPGIAADMFNALASARVNIKMISTSEIKISCLVDKASAKDAVKVIHQRFFTPDTTLEQSMVNEKVGY
jgi:aspartate kinase